MYVIPVVSQHEFEHDRIRSLQYDLARTFEHEVPSPQNQYEFVAVCNTQYNAGAQQELVVICIYEELVTMEFAPPQELPISTTRVHVI